MERSEPAVKPVARPARKRGRAALLSPAELPYEISATAEGRVKIALQGLEIEFPAPSVADLVARIKGQARFARDGIVHLDLSVAGVRNHGELSFPASAAPTVIHFLEEAGRKAEQWQPE